MEIETVTLPKPTLEEMLERAADAGARKALKDLGLQDENASRDIYELRDLLTAWRSTKKAAWQTVVSTVVKAMLVFIAAGVAVKVWASN